MPILSNVAFSVNFDENIVNVTPLLLDTTVTFTDPEGDFNGGTLLVSGLLAEDTLSIRNEGNGAGQIGFDGANVSFAGVPIGVASGGGGVNLTVIFNAAATSVAIDALIQNLTYANTSNAPTASRTLNINVTDQASNETPGPATFVEVTGTANPFDGVDLGSKSAPVFADIDNDTDLDALVGSNNTAGTLNFLRNDGSPTSSDFVGVFGANNPFFNPSTSDVTPSFVDIDGDGVLDLFLGEGGGSLPFYPNSGSVSSPAFSQVGGAGNPLNFDVGGNSAPTFADINNDGDLDAFVGEGDGTINFFENVGSATNPSFTLIQQSPSNPFFLLDVGNDSAPTFIDIDNDGDFDAFVGAADGTINFLRNDGTAASPVFVQAFGAANPFNGVDVGSNSAPTFADIDNDGDPDAFIGEGDGTINFFENRATAGALLTVNITAQNDAPLAAGGVVAINESASRAIGLGDLGFSDPIEGHAFDSMAVLSLPAAGTLSFQGAALTTTGLPRAITAAQLANGDLVYTPPTSGGATLTSFQFTVRDDGGTANGGQDTSGPAMLHFAIGAGNVFVGTPGDDTCLEGSDQNDAIFGLAGNDILNGHAGNDTLFGDQGNDTLIGGTGFDQMFGGLGDDAYFVDDAGDVVTENANEGTDTVTTFVSYTLLANIETMNLAGTDNLNGSGNALVNTINGNTGNNFLDGGLGADTLRGGPGDDTYIIRDPGDLALEGPGEGNDTVTTFISYTLGNNVENLSLAGAGDLQANGSAIDNTIIGNTGNNILNGFLGADTMIGGLGDDLYLVDNALDSVSEAPNQGTDTVNTTITYTLTVNVENLNMIGTGDQGGFGNAQDNTINGNNGANALTGGGGDDIINGGLGMDNLVGGADADTLNGGGDDDRIEGGTGNDILTGGLGAGDDDLFVFTNGSGNDTINDFAAGAGSNDVLDIRAFGFADLAAVQAVSDDNGGAGPTTIQLDADDSITLIGVQVADLHGDDFMLA